MRACVVTSVLACVCVVSVAQLVRKLNLENGTSGTLRL